MQGNGQPVGDGVVHREELQAESTGLVALPLFHLNQAVTADTVLLQLACHQGKGQLGTVDGDIRTLLQQVRNSSDVILVTVGEHQRTDIVQAVRQQAESRKNQVNTRVTVLGKQDTAVDQDNLTADLEGCTIAAHITEPSQRCHTKGSRLQRRGGTQFTHLPQASAQPSSLHWRACPFPTL